MNPTRSLPPPSPQPASPPAWAAVLPPALLQLPLARLLLPSAVLGVLARAEALTVGDLLANPAVHEDLAAHLPAVRQALAQALHDGLARHAAHADDWPAVHAQLVASLSEEEQGWLAQLVGFEQPPASRAALARELGVPVARLEEHADRVRSRLAVHATSLLVRLHHDASLDLASGLGVLLVERATPGTLVRVLADTSPDRELGLRLLAFLFPSEFHCHRGALFGVPPRRFRRLLAALPSLVPPHRLPLPVDTILAELDGEEPPLPRGVLLHALRCELQLAIEWDPTHGEMAAQDPRTPDARLVELLQEAGRPLAPADLLYAYRERFRSGTLAKVSRWLRRSRKFVQLGPESWGLRADHQKELAAVGPLADRVARRLSAEGGRHHVADLLPADERDERTVHYVLDRLAQDPRVRLLGRGDACAASHRRSRVMETLLQSFRRAAGDVVLSMFLGNQPPAHRRLVERLLRHNRLFVQPAPDRIDTLANWPFNEERMQRLLTLVQEHVRRRAGYAHAPALKAAIDRTDLGGDWLTLPLLLDVLRRNGPFEVLPGGIVAHVDTALGSRVRRSVRRALREAGVPLSIEEMVQARPDLGEFTGCLRELLGDDPYVQTPDGVRYVLV